MTLSINENVLKSFNFAKDGLVGHWLRWFILIIVSCIPILNFISFGYAVKIYKGEDIAPECVDYVTMFIDGLKLAIIRFIYMIIPLIIIQASISLMFTDFALIGLQLITLGMIISFIVGLFALIAGVRFAKTEKMMEAFNFSAIFKKIKEIGESHYFSSYFQITFVLGLISSALSVLVILCLASEGTWYIIGFILLLSLFILMPFFLLWQGKFYENLYSLA